MERDPLFADNILPWAKTYARKMGTAELCPEHILLGALKVPDAKKLLTDLLKCPTLTIPQDLEQLLTQVDHPIPSQEEIPLSPPLKIAVGKIYKSHQGVIKAKELLKELLSSAEGKWKELSELNKVTAHQPGYGDVVSILTKLTDRIEDLRTHLKDKIIGQDQAIEQVCDALFAAEVYQADGDNGPQATLTFIGPRGIGKASMVKEIARWRSSSEEKGLMHLDMGDYGDPNAYPVLAGMEKFYSNATPGMLTNFVRDNPECIVLVDDLEKAHPTIQNIFLQILKTGLLQDKYLQTVVDFSKTILIFTTDLGETLYDAPNQYGFLSKGKVSRTMVLDALTTEARVRNIPLLPDLISSLGKGFPVLFHRFEAQDLERLAIQSFEAVSKRLQDRLGLQLQMYDPRIPTLLVLKYGPDPEASHLKTFIENLLIDSIQDILNENRELLLGKKGLLNKTPMFYLTLPEEEWNALDISSRESLRCLIVDDDPNTVNICSSTIPEVVFYNTSNPEDALEYLRTKPADAVLLDLHIGEGAESNQFKSGLSILDRIRSLFPKVPVYLFSEFPERRKLADDVLERIARAGGGRDFVRKDFTTGQTDPAKQPGFFTELRQLLTSLRAERTLRKFLRTRKAIEFDLHLSPSTPGKGIEICISNIKVNPAISAIDRASSFGTVDVPRERLKDVVGMREAKRRLQEVVVWLRNPLALQAMGVEIPRGLLLTGPPGTGKTMLARAVAGEADLPFFAISATDFFSKYVGESEERIRLLFNRARRYAPSVIFIDEIDAIGAQRGSGSASGWRDSVLNQLLVCMDGFSRGDEGPVFIMAATNRVDILDTALTRPGRFDCTIQIEEPDREARRKLLEIRCREIPLGEDVDFDAIAMRTAGLSGASLVQIVKEAAILALRDKSPVVRMCHFEEAVNNVKFGFAEGDRIMSPDAKWATAVHEAGHAVVHILLKPDAPLVQVTILPRGGALGFMEPAKQEGSYTWTYKEIREELQIGLGARAAEELILGKEQITSGCRSDLRSASWLAINAITKWGMDKEAGLFFISGEPSGPALTRAHAWIDEAYESSQKLLEKNKDTVIALAKLLMEKETLSGEEVRAKIVQINIVEKYP